MPTSPRLVAQYVFLSKLYLLVHCFKKCVTRSVVWVPQLTTVVVFLFGLQEKLMRDVDKKKVDPVKDAAIARARYLKVRASLINDS